MERVTGESRAHVRIIKVKETQEEGQINQEEEVALAECERKAM
jgi:hypothetical protein